MKTVVNLLCVLSLVANGILAFCVVALCKPHPTTSLVSPQTAKTQAQMIALSLSQNPIVAENSHLGWLVFETSVEKMREIAARHGVTLICWDTKADLVNSVGNEGSTHDQVRPYLEPDVVLPSRLFSASMFHGYRHRKFYLMEIPNASTERLSLLQIAFFPDDENGDGHGMAIAYGI
ncbi:MAG: hypothetical protein K9N23_05010 [Akkermansiaceae bacterium]|nr:hypothetical protein [Akkermansiaceae bacterium]